MGGLSTARSALASVVLNGKIYAVGGWDGEHYLNSVERFDHQVVCMGGLHSQLRFDSLGLPLTPPLGVTLPLPFVLGLAAASKLYVACCMLHVAPCMLHVAGCTLCVAWYVARRTLNVCCRLHCDLRERAFLPSRFGVVVPWRSEPERLQCEFADVATVLVGLVDVDCFADDVRAIVRSRGMRFWQSGR